jgi:hypothetical protein
VCPGVEKLVHPLFSRVGRCIPIDLTQPTESTVCQRVVHQTKGSTSLVLGSFGFGWDVGGVLALDRMIGTA